MSIEYFTTVIVPGIASVAYFTAGIANIYVGRYALATMWLCYSIANVCLLSTVIKK